MSTKDEDSDAFKAAMAGVKPIVNDTFVPEKRKPTPARRTLAREEANETRHQRQLAAEFVFSDSFEAHFDEQGPLRYYRDDAPSYLTKQLRRGDFTPEWVLDCHGMTRQEVKYELASLLHAAKKQHIQCVSILHGVSGGTLKKAVPNFLVQHPNVLAFHQAPLEYGGHGALLVLIDIPAHR